MFSGEKMYSHLRFFIPFTKKNSQEELRVPKRFARKHAYKAIIITSRIHPGYRYEYIIICQNAKYVIG